MALPILVAVHDDPTALAEVEEALLERYAKRYRVVCLPSAAEARALLADAAAADDSVALVLAAQWLAGGPTGSELLDEVWSMHPRARRALLIEWGDWGQTPTGRAIFDGIARGCFDHYVVRPAASPDEMFHQTISSMLLDWAEANRAAPYTVHIVGDSWSGRAYEIREALQACALPHTFSLADSPEGQQLVAAAGEGTELPMMLFPNGAVLANPTNAEIAEAAGAPIDLAKETVDLVIVGSGPAGLSAAVYGGSEGLSTVVVDRGGIGGQASSSSLIRNYLGFPRGISGRLLARSAWEQAWVFGAKFAFMRSVTSLERDGTELVLSCSDGNTVRTPAVLLSMGASYRRLGVPSLEALVGAGVYYGSTNSEASFLVGRDAFVVGGANSAGQAVLHLANYARKVTLVVRGDSLRASMSEYLVSEIEATPNIDVRLGTKVVDGGGNGRLEELVLADVSTGATTTEPADALFLLIGAQPFTDWLPDDLQRDEGGFVLTGNDLPEGSFPLERPPFPLETSIPGVFAAGDIRHGSVKRVASAVGEGSIAVQMVHQYFAEVGHEPHRRSGDAAAAHG
ncbi:FAD-dependent oxidoreductase [Dermatobacter hominis]|uniref:FAD-dependent oxidoreductase n=1 Tax=Dermatobacter hominis TaxID=2884263 RepID=UPI001D129394|nr:FAD-dependent oxidoreductase [Dermatobacter hominis]UDY37595.1 FAD-dependent oxidoreductase [Dermatobacter hominis]